MIASSSSSPPIRIDWETTIPPSAITATSLVPPPMSTTMLPVGSAIGRPAPTAPPPPSPLTGAVPPAHAPGRLWGGGAGPGRRRDRLLDELALARARREACLLDGTLLHLCYARG